MSRRNDTGKAAVCIVDDDTGMRKSLAMVMESADLLVRTYAAAAELLEDLGADGGAGPCDCVVLDLQMPGMSGIELLRGLRARGFGMPVVVVTGTGTVPAAVESLKLGAVDFLEKPVDHHVLINTVQQALAKHAAARAEAAEVEAVRRRLADLTDRETELLRLVVRGLSNKQIAVEMGISIKTVINHRANLMAKTGALNAADLVRMSMIAGVD